MSNTVVLTFAGDSGKLESAFDRVGAGADRMAGKVDDASGAFGRVGKAADEAGDDVAGGFLDKFRGGIGGLKDVVSDGFSGLPPQVKGVVGVAAAAVGAVFAAGLASAVLLGLGGGILAVGVSQALKDPAVAGAWEQFGERAKGALSGFVEPFKGPVARAADTLGDAVERMGPTLDRIGALFAPLVDRLTPALVDMAERAMPGIEKAAAASVPLFEKLAEHAPEIGDAVASFFDSIADAGPGALIFIDLVLTALTGLIRFWGNGVEFWSKGLEKLNDFFTDKVPRAWDKTVSKFRSGIDWIQGIPGKLRSAFGAAVDIVSAPFIGAFNRIARAWNSTVGSLSWTVPGWVPGFGGYSISAPDLPIFHDGGVVPGAPGQEVIARLQAGETVTPAGRSPGPAVVEVRSDGTRLGDALVEILARAVRVRGGDVQLVLGGGRGVALGGGRG